MAEAKTIKRTITNPNACMSHVNTVRGVVPIGPNQAVEVEVDEAVSAKLDKLIEKKVFGEEKAKAASKSDAK